MIASMVAKNKYDKFFSVFLILQFFSKTFTLKKQQNIL